MNLPAPFIFKRYSDTTLVEPELLAHSGQHCAVLNELSATIVDVPDVGPMFLVRFEDGYEADVFFDELEPSPETAWHYDSEFECWIEEPK